ncbi:WSC domain-containing protein [Lactarius quietus]|nr:WSC domain-containing protein [Lactarius quietus]
MHTPHFPLSRFQMIVTVLLAIVSLTSAQTIKTNVPKFPRWVFKGCYSDTGPGFVVKALNTEVTVPGGKANASVENCIGECNTLIFNYAGVEQGACWCDNAINAVSNIIAQSSCNTPCTGDATELCGGPNAILIYNNPPG